MRGCLLEQSGLVPDRIARARRVACDLRGWGHFRLNWNRSAWHEEDLRSILADGLTWAEGRSLLFAQAHRQAYDYYLFVDDDVLLRPRHGSASRHFELVRAFLAGQRDAAMVADFSAALARIERVWRRQAPVSGNLFSATDWGHRWNANPGALGFGRECFCIGCHDLQTHFFRADLAAAVFPAPVAGSGGSMWYAQFAGTYGWQGGQVCISSVEAFNTRHDPHHDPALSQFHSVDQIHARLAPAIRHSAWARWNRVDLQGEYGKELNRSLYADVLPSRRTASQVSAAWGELFDVQRLGDLRTEMRRHHDY